MQDKYMFLPSVQMCRNPTSFVFRSSHISIALDGTTTIFDSEHIQPSPRGLLLIGVHPLRSPSRETQKHIGGAPGHKFWCCRRAGTSAKDTGICYVWRCCS